MDAWQKCPICNGTGEGYTIHWVSPCKVCSGAGIISTISGLPPNRFSGEKLAPPPPPPPDRVIKEGENVEPPPKDIVSWTRDNIKNYQ
jgi:hypothetical protein